MRPVLALLSVVSVAAPFSFGGTPPPGFTEIVAANGLQEPTDFAFSPSDGALWILEKGGTVQIKRASQPLKQALSINVAGGCEQGLLGIAFDPQFTTNHRVYLYYTATSPTTHNRVARFIESNDTLTPDANIIDDLDATNACNHDGGALRFGNDGYLYAGVGENANPPNSQDLTTPLGKVLRVDTDGNAVPTNPYYNQPPDDPRIWLWGLRNPWKIGFDSANGDLYVGDVGQSTWEEINWSQPGKNYGWPNCEGNCSPPDPQYTDPLFQYDHNTTGAAAIIGGPVYRGTTYPTTYQGVIFYGDLAGWVRYVTIDANHQYTGDFDFVQNADSPTSVNVGPNGDLYYAAYSTGEIIEVAYGGATPPVADFSGTPRTGQAPLGVTFTNLTTGTTTSYAWDFGDGNTSANTNPFHTYTAAGAYTVALTATGPGGSDTATKPAYVVVTANPPENLLSGLGPDPAANPRVQAWDVASQPYTGIDFNAYGSGGFGANVGNGDLNGSGSDEILTGPGPSGVFGPHVRGFFTPSAAPIAKVNFFAYGTLKFGVHAEGGDVEDDGFDEIVTSPGPGAVFGPHVRGFNWDGGTLSAIGKISFFAFSTLRYGARNDSGTIDADAFDEILVTPGPGAVFGPVVRGFNYDGVSISQIAKVNFNAYNGLTYGAEVATADVDDDGIDEILTGPGQTVANPSRLLGWNFDGATVSPLAGLDVTAYNDQYGLTVGGGDLDGDGDAEVLAMPADPTLPAAALGWDYESSTLTALPNINFIADPAARYGGNVEAGDFGF
ncbi:MAG: PQQ-dependent sugar dehydrogenase [Acidobacteriota bacterium]